MKFGRIASDPVRVAQAPAHRFGAVPPPPVLDRSSLAFEPGLYGNDRYPDCTAVAYVNAARSVAALNGYDLPVEDGAALAFYSACVGNPADPATTDGAMPLDVLGFQIQNGVDIGTQRLVARFGVVDTHRSALALSMARFGSGYWGVTLRDRDMQNVAADLPWDIVDGRDDGPVVGAHMVIAFDYSGLADAQTVRIGTWGAWQYASWAWIHARIEEAYGLVWRQLARADGSFYGGVTAEGLYAEL